MELSPTIIKKIKSDKSLTGFVDYLVYHVSSLDTVEGTGDMPNEFAGEEAKVRLKAKHKLLEILHPILDFAEKETIDAEAKDERAKDFGIDP